MASFTYSSLIPAPVGRVFAFHEEPDAIQRLTPPWQRIELVRKTGGIEAGSEVEFRVWLGPLPVTWVARHTEHEHGRLFTDVQVRGPFRRWVHRHEFAGEAGGTRLTDRIEFEVTGGWLGAWVAKQQLRRMFRYRHEVTRKGCAE